MKAAVLTHYGSVKEAAYALGQVDPSLMMREFDDGKWKRFNDHSDAVAQAFVSAEMHRCFGKLDDPKTFARRAIAEIRDRLTQVEQFLEYGS